MRSERSEAMTNIRLQLIGSKRYIDFETYCLKNVEYLKLMIGDRLPHPLPPSEFRVFLSGKEVDESDIQSPNFKKNCHALKGIIRVDLKRFKEQIAKLRGEIERCASVTQTDEYVLAKRLMRLENWMRTLEKYERNTCAETPPEPEPESEIFDSLVGLEVRRLKQIREEIANIEFFRCESLISNRNFRLPYEIEAKLKQLLEQKNEIKACFHYMNTRSMCQLPNNGITCNLGI